jgi:hypothetical protein
MREKSNSNRLDRRIVLYVACVLVCAFLGPFGTSTDLSASDRIVFWTLGFSAVGFFMELCILTAWHSEYLTKLPVPVRSFIGILVGALPGTSCIILLNKIMRPDRLDTVTFLQFYTQVAIFAVIIMIRDRLVTRRFYSLDRDGLPDSLSSANSTPEKPAPQLDVVSPQDEEKAPRLLDRLSPSLKTARVISLTMQDHYVEVTTTLGTEMVLMRLSDAIALLDEMPGVQTHRSHWVAAQSMLQLTKDGRKHQILLTDGRVIPVSKSYLADVTAALKNT